MTDNVTATGTPPTGGNVIGKDSKTVNLGQGPSSISLVKNGILDITVVPPTYQANIGDKINYTFIVTNTGNITLTNVTVIDPKITVIGGPVNLAPGASDFATFTGTYVLTQADITAGHVVNTSAVVGISANGPVTDLSVNDVPVPPPGGLPGGPPIVGINVSPADKLGLLVPWFGLAGLLVLATATAALVARKKHSV